MGYYKPFDLSELENVIQKYHGRHAYLYDDFYDNKYNGDRYLMIGEWNGSLNNLRKQWSVTHGSASVTDKRLILDASATYTIVRTSSTVTEGTWETKVKFENSAQFEFRIISDGTKRIHVKYQSGALKVEKYDGATTDTIISTSIDLEDGEYHTIKVTRDASGNYELFVDGDSKGTGSDSYLPSANYVELCCFAQKTYVDYVEVTS